MARGSKGKVSATAAPKRDERFTEGSWRGLPNYECSACAFKTINRVAFEQHWQAVHAPPAPPPKRSSLLDPTGRHLTLPDTAQKETD